MTETTTRAGAAPRASAFPWYLASSGTWIGAMSLQGFLLTWMLVGILETPADKVGAGRALIEIPGLLVLLLGGIVADRTDGRTLLSRMHVLIALPPLAIAAVVAGGDLTFWWVVGFGVAMGAMQSITDPSRQAMLSRVTRTDIQRTVTVTTIVTSLVGVTAVGLGGQLETIGLDRVLIIQSALFLTGFIAVRRLPSLPVRPGIGRPDLLGGVKATWRLPLVRDVVGLNFLSSLFNAGAYIIAVPFIVTDVYGGDAETLASIMILFTIGSIGSNVVLLRFMPLARPGRLFLLMQLSRVAILTVLWIEPPLWLFYVTMVTWGLNMGVTTTLVRTTVQELAPESHRAQVLSILLLSFMVSSPVSSLLLGTLIAGSDPLTALLPGVAISLVIFAIGVASSGLWSYRPSSRPEDSPLELE